MASYGKSLPVVGDAPTRTLRCRRCSYFLRTFPSPVTPVATFSRRDLFNEQVRPQLTRPYRTVRCRHCGYTTVYYYTS